ncbi:glycosyltransferase family 4 protein [Solirubrobacter phytolaccae]|uniref:Glycosyltransferase family 4 protein n=1 Tax=Solirubrobacter phytolaccae TaxID=1404360 RepID=A0A9X3S8U8_9ACTN|nr:glycosyltransferase family 1 protein [Solirubrobacter phytolaccae]MDA0182659.1 glycosyltransferase family 4 protein [Solirubrobacter phytolaccae]
MRPPAIDARAAARPELGGVERWARELCARLPYTIHRPPPALVHRAGHAWEQAVLPVLSARAPALLCPANLAPVAARNVVVVIHDAAPLRHPGWYSGAYAAFQRRILPLIARRARAVITVSEFSRDELRELLGVEAHVVYGGVDPRFAPGEKAERPYVLCVASHTARKNLRALVPAAQALARQGVELRVAGGHRPQFAAEEGLDALTLLGPVPDEALPALYAGALAFVLPSVYEGFGLPVLEAMAAGTPVVTTNVTALPETSGGAALLVEPDPEALRHALLGLVGDETERARLRNMGLGRARQFSWERTARGVDAVVRSTY